MGSFVFHLNDTRCFTVKQSLSAKGRNIHLTNTTVITEPTIFFQQICIDVREFNFYKVSLGFDHYNVITLVSKCIYLSHPLKYKDMGAVLRPVYISNDWQRSKKIHEGHYCGEVSVNKRELQCLIETRRQQ